MLNRLVAFFIVTFWFVMSLMLVRNEISPDASLVREVPISHVLKLVYLHEQPSDLAVYNGPNWIGSVRLIPRVDRATNTHALDATGDLQLNFGPGSHTRLSWLGLLEMTPAFELKHSKWSVTIQEPGYLKGEMESFSNGSKPRFSLRTHEGVLNEGEIPTDENELSGLAKQFNLGVNFGDLMKQGREQAPPTVHARLSSLRWRGEKTDTFLVTIEQNGQTLLEAHFSQLGQMLQAKTLVGYTLRSTDLVP
jgi:hypothetical protein